MGDTERQEPHHSLFSCSDIYTEGGKKNGRVCIDGRHREREEAPHPLLFSKKRKKKNGRVCIDGRQRERGGTSLGGTSLFFW